MRVALACSAHGFGHLTRQLEVGRALLARGHTPVVFTAAPKEVVHAWLPDVECVYARLDVGLIQQDSLTHDVLATRVAIDELLEPGFVASIAHQLEDHGIDRVVADCPPTVMEAARRLERPCLAVSNFTWPWIYERIDGLEDCAAPLAAWQAPHPAVSLWPGPGMPGFATVEPAGLLGRVVEPHQHVSLGPGTHVLVSFGGLGLTQLLDRLPVVDGITWVVAPPMLPMPRADVRVVSGVPYPALIAACDLVLTKPGYGILAECALAGTPVAWLPRGHFPEAPFLTTVWDVRGEQRVDIGPSDSPPRWRAAIADAVQARLARPPREPMPSTAVDAVVDAILAL